MCIRDSYNTCNEALSCMTKLDDVKYTPVSYTHLDVYKRQFRKTTFFHVLSVVQSESAIISNTIFFSSPYFHFLKEHGSKKWFFEKCLCVLSLIHISYTFISFTFNAATDPLVDILTRTYKCKISLECTTKIYRKFKII